MLSEKYHFKDAKEPTAKEKEDKEKAARDRAEAIVRARMEARKKGEDEDAVEDMFPEAEEPPLEYHPSEVASFLLPMLELLPENRANAGGMANHSWLDDTPGMQDERLEGLVPGSKGEGIEGWASEVKKR